MTAHAAEYLSVRIRIPLRARDIDGFGHVNQSVYHEFLEEGRVALLEAIGRRGEPSFVLAHVELDHRRELRLEDGEATVELRVTAISRSSFALDHDILTRDRTLVASGRSVLVGWDPETRAARPLSPAERERLVSPSPR
jgi:acyl-CoA thioester hydrolase